MLVIRFMHGATEFLFLGMLGLQGAYFLKQKCNKTKSQASKRTDRRSRNEGVDSLCFVVAGDLYVEPNDVVGDHITKSEYKHRPDKMNRCCNHNVNLFR